MIDVLGLIEIFAGFPLPLSDYGPLVDELSKPGRLTNAIRVAHSLGSLAALSTPTDLPTFLLAPSVPGPRPGQWVVRAGLTVASHTPWKQLLASRLRRASYRRYGAIPPPGAALSLADAAERLRLPDEIGSPMLSQIIVLGSRDDPRHHAQVELAARLGATMRWTDGGHMFPITHPADTAEAITAALRH